MKFIRYRHPTATNFYDLFGGGGAISSYALKLKGWQVHYNELNTAVYKWFANLDCPAYLSEYDAPFECVEQWQHRSLLNANDKTKVVTEKLFWNGKGKITKHTLF